MILPLVVALLLHSRHLVASGLFRTLFFLPYVVPFVATVFIWGGMLNPETGWINAGLRRIGDGEAATVARGSGLGLSRAWR